MVIQLRIIVETFFLIFLLILADQQLLAITRIIILSKIKIINAYAKIKNTKIKIVKNSKLLELLYFFAYYSLNFRKKMNEIRFKWFNDRYKSSHCLKDHN